MGKTTYTLEYITLAFKYGTQLLRKQRSVLQGTLVNFMK